MTPPPPSPTQGMDPLEADLAEALDTKPAQGGVDGGLADGDVHQRALAASSSSRAMATCTAPHHGNLLVVLLTRSDLPLPPRVVGPGAMVVGL